MSEQVKHLRVSYQGKPLLDLRGRNVTPKSIKHAVRLFQDLVEADDRITEARPAVADGPGGERRRG